MSRLVGTFAYVPPEMFSGGHFSDRSDIWALGIILWEIGQRLTTGYYEHPYSQLKLSREFQILFQTAVNDVRCVWAPDVPPAWKALTEKCWEKNPEERPSILQIEEDFATLQSSLGESTPWISVGNNNRQKNIEREEAKKQNHV